MLGDMLIRVLGHGLARNLFKESADNAAQRIEEERIKKRKEHQKLLRGIPTVLAFAAFCGFILYLIYLANK
jgi:hypothetical protein